MDDDASALAAGSSLIRALGFAAAGFSSAAAFLGSDALSAVADVIDAAAMGAGAASQATDAGGALAPSE